MSTTAGTTFRCGDLACGFTHLHILAADGLFTPDGLHPAAAGPAEDLAPAIDSTQPLRLTAAAHPVNILCEHPLAKNLRKQ